MKKRANLALVDPPKNQKLGLKKTTLQDLDAPKLNEVAGGCSIQPTTTAQPTHQTVCITTKC